QARRSLLRRRYYCLEGDLGKIGKPGRQHDRMLVHDGPSRSANEHQENDRSSRILLRGTKRYGPPEYRRFPEQDRCSQRVEISSQGQLQEAPLPLFSVIEDTLMFGGTMLVRSSGEMHPGTPWWRLFPGSTAENSFLVAGRRDEEEEDVEEGDEEEEDD